MERADQLYVKWKKMINKTIGMFRELRANHRLNAPFIYNRRKAGGTLFSNNIYQCRADRFGELVDPNRVNPEVQIPG